MSSIRAIESFATWLEGSALPAIKTRLQLPQLDARITSDEPDEGMSVRLWMLDESDEGLEGAHYIQLTLKVPRYGAVDDFTALQLREEIRRELGFDLTKAVKRTWLSMQDYSTVPPRTVGVCRVELQGSKFWVTDRTSDPGLIQSAMRLKIYFDGGQ